MEPVRCIECWQATETCFCNQLSVVESPMRVLILQHPQESRRPKSTARLLALSLKGSIHRVGLSWPSLSSALKQPARPENWAVLFLGPRKDSDAFKPQEKIRIVDRKGGVVPRPKIDGLIVLDGNWKQSKTLWWRNPWLVRIKRVLLNPSSGSEYGVYRKQPRANCLSTLESAATCIAILAKTPATEQVLKDNQGKFLERFALPRRLDETQANLGQETLN